jgi:hypothetical protein
LHEERAMAVTVHGEVRARLDAHLDAVDRALAAAGSSRERRRGVVDDLEAQILEMLGAKTDVPTVGDLEEVLARLDPPGAYGQGAAGETTPRATVGYSRAAMAGLLCILFCVPLLVVLSLVGHSAGPGNRSIGAIQGLAAAAMATLALAGTILGWVALGQIKRSGGTLQGKGLAWFDGLFCPVMFVLIGLTCA